MAKRLNLYLGWKEFLADEPEEVELLARYVEEGSEVHEAIKATFTKVISYVDLYSDGIHLIEKSFIDGESLDC